jgi:hypothetical protein
MLLFLRETITSKFIYEWGPIFWKTGALWQPYMPDSHIKYLTLGKENYK